MFKLKNPKIFKIDFAKPWWTVIFKQKWTFLIILLHTSVIQIVWTLIPFLISYIFESKSFIVCIVIFSSWIALELLYRLSRQLNAQFQLQCIHSFYQNAHHYLLTIDPKYHVHRSSGAILGKIDRAGRGYEDLLDYTTDEFTPLIIGLTTVIIAMLHYSFYLACIMTLFILLIIGTGYYFARSARPRQRAFIKTDDEFKTIAVENLAQIHLIRSTFATDFRFKKLTQAIYNNMNAEGSLWLFYTNTFSFLHLLYLLSLFTLALYLLWQIDYGITTITAALGLFLSYLQSSKSITSIMKIFRKTNRSVIAIKDFFEFIETFGKQGFPVLEYPGYTIVKPAIISIQASDIYFDYGKAALFNNHSFSLTASQKRPDKLYGIIGPSGSGKSTLLAILGGQLKPISGSVTINGIDIYSISDAMRRQLIALQGQIATNLQGTVKNNLLLGIPEENTYTDQQLLDIIEKVGLLSVLNSHQGLDTLLGEGGLNLSGGQRQRLNFAGLYLRANYYKPSVILIDEPTSSLDDISEAAITSMILELSQSALTLVIAHRLKTVQEAVGLIDLSLLSETKEITAYSPEQLAEQSVYYKELLQGKVLLDS